MKDAKGTVPRRYEWMLRFLRLLGGSETKGHLTEIILSWRTSDLSNAKHPPAWAAFDTVMTDLARANAKLEFTLNIFDNTETKNHWFYMACLGLQTFHSLQRVSTTLAVNMGSSWSERETFDGSLISPKRWVFKYEAAQKGPPSKPENEEESSKAADGL